MSAECSIEGCTDARFSRGWCKKHYAKWYRHGDPTAGRQHRRTPETPSADREQAVADYLAGETAWDLAFAYGVSDTTILNWVRAAGHRPRPRGQAPSTSVTIHEIGGA